MKIYEVEFNANAPTKKQIQVPLNTNYGVDVSMVCNGQKATNLSVEVEGQEASEGTAVSFTSGSEPGIVEKNVSITGKVGEKIIHEEFLDGVPNGIRAALKVKLTGITLPNARADQMVYSIVRAGEQPLWRNATGPLAPEPWFPEGYDSFWYPGAKFSIDIPREDIMPGFYTQIWAMRYEDGTTGWNTNMAGTGTNYPTYDITPDLSVEAFFSGFQGQGGISCTGGVGFTGDAYLTKDFKLQVNEEDMGYYDKSLGFTGQTNLSGTYTDGTEFNYTVVTK